jgi:hypothetical protein
MMRPAPAVCDQKMVKIDVRSLRVAVTIATISSYADAGVKHGIGA